MWEQRDFEASARQNTGSFEYMLELKTRVSYVTDGLMNGAVGTVKHLDFNSANPLKTIYVRFDNPSIGQNFYPLQYILTL